MTELSIFSVSPNFVTSVASWIFKLVIDSCDAKETMEIIEKLATELAPILI